MVCGGASAEGRVLAYHMYCGGASAEGRVLAYHMYPGNAVPGNLVSSTVSIGPIQ